MTPRRTRFLASAVLALAALTTALPAASAAPGTTTVQVGRLDRGGDPQVPQVLGTTILDGDRRTEVEAREVHLLGRAESDYVAIVYSDSGDGNVERIAADGTRTVLSENADWSYTVSDDGLQLFESRTTSNTRTVVVVRDTATGDRVARRVFRNAATVLDASDGRAVLGLYNPARTLWWDTAADRTKRIADRYGYEADISSDRYATLIGDPWDGGCSVVAALSAPRKALWRSCDHAVLAFSPGGERLLTHAIYLDGPVSQLQVRGDHGKLLHTFRAKGGFGSWDWESDRAVLLLTRGPQRTAVVRCATDGACERASRTIRSTV